MPGDQETGAPRQRAGMAFLQRHHREMETSQMERLMERSIEIDREMALVDLGSRRANWMRSVSGPGDVLRVNTDEIERDRECNKPGTAEYEFANSTVAQERISGWLTLQTEEAPEDMQDFAGGQTHRARKPEHYLTLAPGGSRGDFSTRGGRSGRGGRGGGVIGTRGRGSPMGSSNHHNSTFQDMIQAQQESVPTRRRGNFLDGRSRSNGSLKYAGRHGRPAQPTQSRVQGHKSTGVKSKHAAKAERKEPESNHNESLLVSGDAYWKQWNLTMKTLDPKVPSQQDKMALAQKENVTPAVVEASPSLEQETIDGSMVESTGFGDAPSGFEEDEDMASNLESMSAPTEQIVEAQAEEPYDFGGPTDTTIATEHAIHEEQSEPQPAAQVSGSEGVGLMDRITEIGAEILSTGQELEQTTKEIEQIERNIDNIMLKFRQSGYNIALLTAELSTPGEKRRTLTEKKEALTKKRDSLIIELQALLLGGQPVCVAQEDNKQDLHAAQEADLRDLHTDQKNVHDLHAGQENNVHKLLAAQENDVNEQPTVEPPPATPEQTLIEFSPERKPEGVKPLLQMKPLEGKFLGLEISSHYDPKFEPPKVYYPKPAEARIGPHNDLGARRHILEGEAKREAATRHGLDQLASQTPPATRECSVSEIQSMEPKQTMAPKTLFDDFQGEKAMPAKKPHGTQKATTKPAAAARLTHYDATVHGQQGSSLSTRVSATRGSTHKPSAVPESVALASGDLGINMKAEEAQPLISLDQKSVEQSKSRPPTTAGRPPLQATTAQASQHQAGSRPIPKAPNVAAGEGWTWEHVKLLGAGWIDSRADNTEETTRVGHAKKAEPSRSAGSQSVPPHLRSKDAPPASQSRPLQDVSTNKIVESPNTLGGATTYHPPPLVRSKAPTLSSPPENSMNKLPSRSTPYIPDSAMARQYGQEPKTEVATSKLPSQMVPNLPDNAITRQYAGVRSLPPHQRSAVQPGQAQSSQPPAAPLARTLDVPNIPFSAATRQYAARRDPIADVSAQMSKLHLRESAQGSENVPPRSQRRDNTFGLGASSHAPAAQTGNSRNRRGSVESDLMDFESDAAVRPSTASDDERERIMNLSTDDMFKRPLLTKSRIILPDFVDSKPDLKDPGAAARKQYMKG